MKSNSFQLCQKLFSSVCKLHVPSFPSSWNILDYAFKRKKNQKKRCVYASVNSSCAQPPPPPPSPPPGYCRAFARLVSPEDEAFANFAKFVKACSRFYACISSLLIKPELHSENGSYRLESTFFWLLNQISVDVIEEHSFLFIKLFITVNFTLHY